MNFSRLICCISLLVMVGAPAKSFAADNRGAYILVKPGAFVPTNDLDRKGFDSTFSGEIVIGSYFYPNLAVEAGVGWYQTDASMSATNFTGETELSVIPVTATLKGVIPLMGAELNAGIGPGVYFTSFEAKGGNAKAEEHPAVFGGHLLIGGAVDISKNVFVGAEGKYIFTTGTEVFGSEIKLNGFIASVIFGFRL